MGLITGLLTLPLAPVRGTIWIAEQIAAEAERRHELGELSLEEYEAVEDTLLERLEHLRELRREGTIVNG